MAGKYHLELQGSHWCLIDEADRKVIASFWTKKEGMSHALSYVERHGGSLVIHRLDGSFQEEHAYPGFELPFATAGAASAGSQSTSA